MALKNIALVGNSEKYKIGARSTFKRKNQLVAAFVIGIALTSLFMITAKPAPVWTYLGTSLNDYIILDNGFVIVPGQGAISGKYYKIDASSATSGFDASHYEVSPAGFPIGFAFIDQGYGINGFNFIWFFIDVLIWMIFAYVIIYKFGFFEKSNKKVKQL